MPDTYACPVCGWTPLGQEQDSDEFKAERVRNGWWWCADGHAMKTLEVVETSREERHG